MTTVDEAINYVTRHTINIYMNDDTADIECGRVFFEVELDGDGYFDQNTIIDNLISELEVDGDAAELNDFGLAALECFNVKNAIE